MPTLKKAKMSVENKSWQINKVFWLHKTLVVIAVQLWFFWRVILFIQKLLYFDRIYGSKHKEVFSIILQKVSVVRVTLVHIFPYSDQNNSETGHFSRTGVHRKKAKHLSNAMFNSSNELRNLNLPFFKRRPKEQSMSVNAYSTLSISFTFVRASCITSCLP